MKIEELKQRLASTEEQLASELRSLPFADGQAYYQSCRRIDDLREEKNFLRNEIDKAEKGGEE